MMGRQTIRDPRQVRDHVEIERYIDKLRAYNMDKLAFYYGERWKDPKGFAELALQVMAGCFDGERIA